MKRWRECEVCQKADAHTNITDFHGVQTCDKCITKQNAKDAHRVTLCKSCWLPNADYTVHGVAGFCARCYQDSLSQIPVVDPTKAPEGAKSTTQSVLAEAEGIINGDRRNDYGPVTESFQRIADLWQIVLRDQVVNGELRITAADVALCLIQLKIARSMQDTTNERPVKRDSIVDIAGYAGCLEKIGRGE